MLVLSVFVLIVLFNEKKMLELTMKAQSSMIDGSTELFVVEMSVIVGIIALQMVNIKDYNLPAPLTTVTEHT